jgi:hypothetical protein
MADVLWVVNVMTNGMERNEPQQPVAIRFVSAKDFRVVRHVNIYIPFIKNYLVMAMAEKHLEGMHVSSRALTSGASRPYETVSP